MKLLRVVRSVWSAPAKIPPAGAASPSLVGAPDVDGPVAGQSARPSGLRSSLLVPLALLAGPLPASAEVRFALTDLGTLGGADSEATGINAAGNVVGNSTPAGATFSHAFFWQSGTGMQDLGTLGGLSSVARGINAAGQVVGQADTPRAFHGFVWQAGRLQDLGASNVYGGASGINAAGQAVGYAKTASISPAHAVLWQNGQTQDLGTLGGGDSYAQGINDAGQVVGQASTSGSTYRAFLWQSGVMQDLGTLGGTYSAATAINATGQVVGEAQTTGNAAAHAFLWQGGRMQDLGTLGGRDSVALGINVAGQVVGHSSIGSDATTHAFLRGAQGGMTDLNDLLATGSGAVVNDAKGINDSGQIAGAATIAGQRRAVLLTPTGSVAWSSGGAGGSFSDGARWEHGFAPSRFIDAVIAPAGGETISVGADATVKSLVLGAAAGASGRPELVLHIGAGLTAIDGVTVQATGTLSGNGTIRGSLSNLGTVQANNLTITGSFDNAGLVNGSGFLNANLNNAAAGQVQSGAGDVLRVVGTSHVNQGLIDISGGGTQRYTGRLDNAAGGRILLNNAVLRLDDGLSNAGQVQVSFGGTTVYGALTTTAGGKIILSGNSDATFTGALDVASGGELRVSGGSTGVFFGPVHQRTGSVFSGTGAKFYEGGLSIGNSPGRGTDGGDVSFGAGNTYLEEIGGLAAGTQFDQYAVAGTLGFGGTLKVVWWGSFTGQAGQQFDVFDWRQASGTFAAIDLSGAPLAAGLRWDTSKLYVTGEIGITAVPEPQTRALLLVGLALVGCAGRRTARSRHR